MRITRTRRSVCMAVLMAVVLSALAVVAANPAAANHVPTPEGPVVGTGLINGTELLENQGFDPGGACAFKVFQHVFGWGAEGTVAGKTPEGDPVVYRALLGAGQSLHEGPLRFVVDSPGIFYHGPAGTHGTDNTCSDASIGAIISGSFTVFAADHVYKLDGEGAKVPCTGAGTWGRAGLAWHGQWQLDSACTVVGNAAGTEGVGTSPAQTVFTHEGTHAGCGGSCTDNFQLDYNQYFPEVGLNTHVGGVDTVALNRTAALTAVVGYDGAPLAGATVNFSVSGPGAATPATGTDTTGADGAARFSFSAGVEGDYVVTATATSDAYPGVVTTDTHTVFFTGPLPSVSFEALSLAQTGDPVSILAIVRDDSNPVGTPQSDPISTPVNFSVTGPAGAVISPPSGTVVATVDSDGEALFSFTADRAGTYTVTGSGTYAGRFFSATHTVEFEVKTLFQAGAINMAAGESPISAGVMDPAGRYAYYATTTAPGKVIKIDLATFTKVGVLSLNDSLVAQERNITSAVIDPVGRFAYFGTGETPNPARIVKVDLNTFTRVGRITLADFEYDLQSAAVDPAGQFAYFVGRGGKVIKINLATFTRVGVLTSPAEITGLTAPLIDPAGQFAYFGAGQTDGAPGKALKVDLSTFQVVDSFTFGERNATSRLIDPAGEYAYFSVGRYEEEGVELVKIDLSTFEPVGSLPMPTPGRPYGSLGKATVRFSNGRGVVEPSGRFAYFGADGDPFVAKINLETFDEVILMPVTGTDGSGLRAALIDPAGAHAYFATQATGTISQVVKLNLDRPANPALVAGNEAYATDYVTPLNVAAPGVLGNDTDTGDADPLVAGHASNPPGGSVALNPDGSFTYTPDVGFSGVDTFTYRASDGKDLSAPATVTVTVGPPPPGVQSVSGGAFGYFTNVGLFGGAPETRGPAPAVTLPLTGGNQSATDPDGDAATYGPAYLFGGRWPDDVASAQVSGPLAVSTQGSTGAGGSVTSSADITTHDPPKPVQCYGEPSGTTNCTAPGGIGPGPLVADEAHSTCQADASGVSGSSTFANGVVELKHDPETGDVLVSEPIPENPPPNYTRSGTLDHLGDRYTIVFNEQIVGPDSITVNAAHVYLLGDIAIGEMIVAQSRCGIENAVSNAAPDAVNDTYFGLVDQPVVVGGPGVLANDSDPESQPLTLGPVAGDPPPAAGGGTWSFPSDPAHGTLELNGDGSFSYTPDAGYLGTDTFKYLAQDPRGRTDVATVIINIGVTLPKPVADFDGNGSSDVAIYRPSSGDWYVRGGLTSNWGTTGDIAVPGDYNGDRSAEVAVFRPSQGVWYVQGGATVAWGTSGDIPVPGDYDGNGSTDIAVFRPSTGTWFILGGATVAWGTSGDVPVPGDYDGNGTTDIAVFRPSNSTWYIQGGATVAWGTTGDIPVPGDYNGDRSIDIAIYRPSTATWYVRGGTTAVWGTSGDIPAPGDYDGNGTTDIAVYRPSSGQWYVRNGATTPWGISGDQPVALPPAVRLAYFG